MTAIVEVPGILTNEAYERVVRTLKERLGCRILLLEDSAQSKAIVMRLKK